MDTRDIADGPDLQGLRHYCNRDRPVIFAMADGTHVEVTPEREKLIVLDDGSVVLYCSDASGRLKIEFDPARPYGAKGLLIADQPIHLDS
jgi:hypothetical protein